MQHTVATLILHSPPLPSQDHQASDVRETSHCILHKSDGHRALQSLKHRNYWHLFYAAFETTLVIMTYISDLRPQFAPVNHASHLHVYHVVIRCQENVRAVCYHYIVAIQKSVSGYIPVHDYTYYVL